MGNYVNDLAFRENQLGRRVASQQQDITTHGPGTYGLFQVVGGEVLITSLHGKVSTAITTALETLNLQTNPTTGDTVVVAAATDLGSTDTAAGTTIGVSDDSSAATLVKGGRALQNLVVTTGQIESVVVTAASNGVVDWVCTYVPLTDGAYVQASTQAFA